MNIKFIPLDLKRGTGKQPPSGFKWKINATTDISIIEQWLSEGYSLGAVCGEGSDGLEVIDFDDAELFEPWLDAVAEEDEDLSNELVVVQTRKGFHVYYYTDHIEGNQKLAQSEDGNVLIETRGEGGYVQCPNLNADDYAFVNGGYDDISRISETARDVLLSTARRYNQLYRRPYIPAGEVGDGKPGDDYNNRVGWPDVLEPHGWVNVRHRSDGVSEWRRPGKSDGISATTNINDSDLLYVFTSSAGGLEPNRGYTKFTAYSILNHGGDFSTAARCLAAEGYGGEVGSEGGGSGGSGRRGNDGAVAKLRTILDKYTLFRGEGGRVYAHCPEGAFSLDSDEMYGKLLQDYAAEHGKWAPERALNETISATTKLATLTVPKKETYMRLGSRGNALYWDMARHMNRAAIRIDRTGWAVDDNHDMALIRSQNMHALPDPVRGGDLSELRKLINVSDSEWILVATWLVACFMPHGTIPILIMQGDAGTGKSTATRILRRLIDPRSPSMLTYPNSADTLIGHAYNNYVMAYDNLSGISNEVSDALCSIASGAGYATRKLYTNFEQAAFKFKRPVILNGIDDIAHRNDFASRSLDIRMHAIETYMSERDLAVEIERVLPKAMGALLDIVSTTLKSIDNIGELSVQSRLSDFLRWGMAAAESPLLPWSGEDLLTAYSRNRSQLNYALIDNIPVASAVMEYMMEHDEIEASAGDLLSKLDQIVSSNTRRSNHWPHTPAAFGRALSRVAPILKAAGVAVDKYRKAQGVVYYLKARKEEVAE